IEQVIISVGPEQWSEPAEDEPATPPRPGRTREPAVEPRMPELRLQGHVGNGAVAEHPVTQVAPAGEKMPAAAGSGKACAGSAAPMPAATTFSDTQHPRRKFCCHGLCWATTDKGAIADSTS